MCSNEKPTAFDDKANAFRWKTERIRSASTRAREKCVNVWNTLERGSTHIQPSTEHVRFTCGMRLRYTLCLSGTVRCCQTFRVHGQYDVTCWRSEHASDISCLAVLSTNFKIQNCLYLWQWVMQETILVSSVVRFRRISVGPPLSISSSHVRHLFEHIYHQIQYKLLCNVVVISLHHHNVK